VGGTQAEAGRLIAAALPAVVQRRSEYLLEFKTIGRLVKVSAVDPETGEEISVTGPANAEQDYLKRTAVRKLEYVLAKKGLL